MVFFNGWLFKKCILIILEFEISLTAFLFSGSVKDLNIFMFELCFFSCSRLSTKSPHRTISSCFSLLFLLLFLFFQLFFKVSSCVFLLCFELLNIILCSNFCFQCLFYLLYNFWSLLFRVSLLCLYFHWHHCFSAICECVNVSVYAR